MNIGVTERSKTGQYSFVKVKVHHSYLIFDSSIIKFLQSVMRLSEVTKNFQFKKSSSNKKTFFSSSDLWKADQGMRLL